MKRAKAGTCPYCRRRHSSEYLCEAEVEAREIDYELREKEDYKGLIGHYQTIFEWASDGVLGLHQLGEAYVLNGEPEKAIELLSEPHRQHPRNREFQRVILDALFALGKDEDDFEWVERMPIYRLDASVLDRCYGYLNGRRKPRTVHELQCEITLDGYCVFTPQELLEAISVDERFVVEEEDFWSPGIHARSVA